MRSIEEATMEMELQIRESEEKDPVPVQVTEAVNDNSIKPSDKKSSLEDLRKASLVNGRSDSPSKYCVRHTDSVNSTVVSSQNKDVKTNGFNHSSVNPITPPTPPPSPPAEEQANDNSVTTLPANANSSANEIPKLKPDTKSTVQYTNSINSAKNSEKLDDQSNSTAPALNFSIQPYGSGSPVKKIQTKVWEPSPAKPVITTSTKHSTVSAKPAISNFKQSDSTPVPKTNAFLNSSIINSSKLSSGAAVEKSSKVNSVTKTTSLDTTSIKQSTSSTSSSRSFPSMFGKSSSKSSSSPTYVSEEQPSPPPAEELFKERSMGEKLNRASSRATVRGQDFPILKGINMCWFTEFRYLK